MGRQQRIIELRSEIARLKDVLEQEQNAYITEALANGIKSEEFEGYRFRVQRKKTDKAAVPGQFFKMTIDEKVVRQYLKRNGAQPWGALRDNEFMLIIRQPIHGQAADAELSTGH